MSAAIRVTALVCGFELIVARMTARQVTASDAATSAAAWLGVAVLLAIVVRAADRGPRTAARQWFVALAGRSPVLLLALSFLMPVVGGRTVETTLAVLSVAVLALAAPALGRRGFPSTSEVIPTLLAVTVLAFALDGRGWPELSRYAPFAALWVGAAFFARRPGVACLWAAVAAIGSTLAEPIRLHSNPALPRARAGAPDVYLLTVDTLRRDVAYEMESFQALADAGVRFDAAQSSAPWTLPAMATIMTAADPIAHGAGRIGEEKYSPIRANLPTLASRLGELGYDTVAITATNPYVGQQFGFRRGFATFEHPLAGAANPLPRGFTVPDLVRPLMARVIRPRRGLNSWSAADIVDRVEQLVAMRRHRPVFVWLHFMDCHTPYRHLGDLPDETREAAPSLPLDQQPDFFGGRPDRQVARRAAYLNEVSRLDRALVRFLEILDRHDDRPSVVVLVADHGEELFERQRFGHGHHFYQELLGVPLVVRGLPGGIPGSRVETPVGTRDIHPTLVRVAAGTSAGADRQLGELSGHADLLRPFPDRSLVAQNLMYPTGSDFRWAVRRGHWKALYTSDGRAALFDLDNDPAERADLARQHPEVVESLRPALVELKSESTSSVPISESEREAMRRLGYDTP